MRRCRSCGRTFRGRFGFRRSWRSCYAIEQNRSKLLTNLRHVADLHFPFAHFSGERRLNRVDGFVRFDFAKLIVDRNRIPGIFQKRNDFRVANAFAHDRDENGLHISVRHFCRSVRDFLLRRNSGFPAVRDRGCCNSLSSCRNGTVERGDDSIDIRKRGVFVNRIVADHHIRFAHQNRRAHHLIPKIGLRRDVRDDHLPDAAILGVFLNNHEPAGFVDRGCDRFFVPWHNRAQIEKLDADVVIELRDCFERLLNGVAPRDNGHVRAVAKFARLTEGNRENRFFRFALRPKHVLRN